MKKTIYIFLLFYSYFCGAQTQLFTADDGLSNKNITCILQTRNGYLWIGTANGLNIYDGYVFREYNRETGLSNSKIKCLLEDEKGLLWIGTWEGLSILNQKTGEIKRYFNKGKTNDAIGSEVTALERSRDGSILVGIGDGVILNFKDENSYSKVFQLPVYEKVFKHQIYQIKSLADSSILLLTNYAAVRRLKKNFQEDLNFNLKVEASIRLDLSDDMKTLVLEDVWGNIIHANPYTGKMDPKLPSMKPAGPKDILFFGYLAKHNKVWTGYGDGSLLVTDLTTQQTTDHSYDLKNFITGASTCIYEDKKGILWVGTNYGLVKFCPKTSLFERHLFVKDGDYKSKNSIRGIIEDRAGNIYIGGYNGLFRISGKDSSIKHFIFKDETFGKTNAHYPYRLLDDSIRIWITSEIKGFYAFNKITEKLEFPVNTSAFFKAYALLTNDKKSLWIGSQNGLFLFDKRTKKLKKHSSLGKSIDISSQEIIDLVKDREGTIWIGTYSAGIFKMDSSQKIIQQFSDATTKQTINFISALFSESDSILWAGTRGGGLFRINTKTEKIKVYTKKNGLADNSIAGIEEGKPGVIWISTFNGLSKLDIKSGRFENYYDKDGLTDNEFNICAHLKTKNGKLYFGGLNGVNSFYPEALKKEKKEKPKLFLTRFVKYNGATDKLEEQTLDLSDLKEIELSYKDKFFSFFFTLDDYFDPLRNTFSYKLDGYDNDWTNLGTQNNIRFNSLPPGNFTLKIKGQNSEGTSASNEIILHISVSTAFYTTWWFYLLVFCITVTLVFLITRYRIHQGLKMRKLRTKISSDLHDEVGSLLTRITIQAELMKQGISQNTTAEEVTKIADTSRLATAAMSDVLWSIDARNDKIGNLLDRLREQAGEILFPLEIEVDFSVINIDPEKEIDTIVRQNLFLIFKEAIHNIAKHSSTKKVSITLENSTRQFVMLIRDEGPAKKNRTEKKGQGVRNMRMRAELLEGIIEIEEQAGYKITLKIKKL